MSMRTAESNSDTHALATVIVERIYLAAGEKSGLESEREKLPQKMALHSLDLDLLPVSCVQLKL